MKSKETIIKTAAFVFLVILMAMAAFVLVKGWVGGYFELAGSTIILLFEKEQMQLRPELLEQLSQGEEVRVKQGEWIGTAERSSAITLK